MILPMNFDNHVKTPTSGSATSFKESAPQDSQPGLTAGMGPELSSKLTMTPADRPPFGKQLAPS